MRTLLVVTSCLFAVGCSFKNTRPKTAMELCEKVRGQFEGKTDCSLSGTEQLTLFQAVEAATVTRIAENGERTEVGWVAYTEPNPKVTLGTLLAGLGRGLAEASMLSEHNPRARVSLYAVRGSLSAANWDEVSQRVRVLVPAE